MSKGSPNKRYTPEFKKLVVVTMYKEKQSYHETDRRFGLPDKRAQKWERIYFEEEPEVSAVERRSRSSKERPRKLPKETEEDQIAQLPRATFYYHLTRLRNNLTRQLGTGVTKRLNHYSLLLGKIVFLLIGIFGLICRPVCSYN